MLLILTNFIIIFFIYYKAILVNTTESINKPFMQRKEIKKHNFNLSHDLNCNKNVNCNIKCQTLLRQFKDGNNASSWLY